MMRQTCTVQVNLDFGRSDNILSKRFAAAQFFSPILTAMFANSPFVDGKRSAHKSFRGRIWLDVDRSRCGFVGDSPESWFENDRRKWAKAYTEKVWNSSVVMMQSGDSWKRPDRALSFGEWVTNGNEGQFPEIKALELQATLLFPEVRAKGFMELRAIDAQLQKWQSVPGTILSGALYNEASLDELCALAVSNSAQWDQILSNYLNGLENPLVATLAKKLFEIGIRGVQRLPDCFYSAESLGLAQQFYESFTKRNLCPADQLIGIAAEKGAPLNLKDLYEIGRLS
jgi:glutamate--cysteine ligase